MLLLNILFLLFGELELWVVIIFGFVYILIVFFIVLYRYKLIENVKFVLQIVVIFLLIDLLINENIGKVKGNSLYLMLYFVKGFLKGVEEYFLEILFVILEKYIFYDGWKSGCLEFICNWINCNKNNMNNFCEYRMFKN